MMKFGIALPNFGKYAAKKDILEIAALAEELGYDSLWTSDHVVIPDSHKGFGDVFYDPLITLGFIAASTTKIALGTSVLILPYRNPVVTAKMISTLDALSGGRVILGVGAGWLEDEFRVLGVSYKERGAVTEEYIEILKELWSRDDPAYTGKYLSFSDIKFLPKPRQKPHPPIWVGGGSPIAIERAVRYGDGWHPVGLTPRELKEKADYLKALLPEEKKKSFIISLRKTLEINEEREFGEKDTLRGGPEKIIRGIEEYREAGASHLVLHILSGEFSGVLKTMEIFSKKLKPHLQ